MDKFLGRKVNKIRKQRGLTSERLSEICDVSPVHIRQIESGRRMPSVPLLVKICNGLQVTPNYLLGDKIEIGIIEPPSSHSEIIKRLNKLTWKQEMILTDLLDAYLKHYE